MKIFQKDGDDVKLIPINDVWDQGRKRWITAIEVGFHLKASGQQPNKLRKSIRKNYDICCDNCS